MGRFDFASSEQPKQEQVGRPVGGKYECQHCGEKVRGGQYDREEMELTWVCSKGHLSYVKGMEL